MATFPPPTRYTKEFQGGPRRLPVTYHFTNDEEKRIRTATYDALDTLGARHFPQKHVRRMRAAIESAMKRQRLEEILSPHTITVKNMIEKSGALAGQDWIVHRVTQWARRQFASHFIESGHIDVQRLTLAYQDFKNTKKLTLPITREIIPFTPEYTLKQPQPRQVVMKVRGRIVGRAEMIQSKSGLIITATETSLAYSSQHALVVETALRALQTTTSITLPETINCRQAVDDMSKHYTTSLFIDGCTVTTVDDISDVESEFAADLNI